MGKKKDHLKSVQEKKDLWNRAMSGDVDAMMTSSLKRGMITKQQLNEFKLIKKMSG